MMRSGLISVGSFGTFVVLWSTIGFVVALYLCDGEFESSISILSALELCLDCAICWTGRRDTCNICTCNSIFLVDFGDSLTSSLGRRVLRGCVSGA